jgi:hypothetical protein
VDGDRVAVRLVDELRGCNGVDSLVCPGRALSWEQNEQPVCDIPTCANGTLSLMICRLNVSQCAHRPDGPRCEECFRRLMALERRLVGTGAFEDGLPLAEQRRVMETLASFVLTSKSSTEVRPAGRRRLARQEWHGSAEIVMDLATDLEVRHDYEEDLLLAGAVIDEFKRLAGFLV